MSITPPPLSVRLAVGLMWVGAVLTLLWPVHTLTHLDSLRSQLRDSLVKSDPVYADPEIHQYTSAFYDVTMVAVAVVAIIGAMVGVALWVWMALKNGEGRSWARVLATVFGGLALLATVPSLTWGPETGLEVALAAVFLVLATTILVLLWCKQSSEFYAARSRPQYG